MQLNGIQTGLGTDGAGMIYPAGAVKDIFVRNH